MKKLILCAALAASVLSVFAEKTRLATVVVAGRAGLTQAVNKVAELSCNAMLAGFAQGALAECPEAASVYAVTEEDGEPDIERIANPKKPKLGKDVVAQLSLNAKNLVAFARKQNEFDALPEDARQALGELEKFSMLVRVNDKGITAEMKVALAKDSKLAASYPPGVLEKDALAFAGKDCLAASVSAKNGGSNFGLFRAILKLVEQQGVKLDFLTVAGEDGDCFLTLDASRVKASLAAQKKALDAFDARKFEAAVTNLQTKTLPTPAGRCSFALKGYAGAWTPAERFAATLPEVAAKPLVSQGVGSLYGLLKAVAPAVVDQIELGEEAEQVKTVIKGLPAEQKGAVACAAWLTGPTSGEVWMRISADEIKAFGLASSSAMALAMSCMETSADDDDGDADGDTDAED